MANVLEKSTIKKIVAQINDGDVEEAASSLELLKRSWAYGTVIGKKLYKAHEEVTIGVPEKAVHILEDLTFDLLELVATEIRPGRYAIRPKGGLGTCGEMNGQLWTVKYVNRVPKGMKLEA